MDGILSREGGFRVGRVKIRYLNSDFSGFALRDVLRELRKKSQTLGLCLARGLPKPPSVFGTERGDEGDAFGLACRKDGP